LNEILKKNHATVEEFRGIKVSKNFVHYLAAFAESSLLSYLYQTGYLTLRPGNSEDNYSLDYPNREVLLAMSNLLVTNILGHSLRLSVVDNLQQALDKIDVEVVIAQFDQFLSKVIYADFNDAKSVSVKHVTVLDTAGKRYYFNAFFFRCLLSSLLNLAGARVSVEARKTVGKDTIVFEWNQRFWVIELKVAKKRDNVKTLLANAVEGIRSQSYAAAYDDPVCLAIVINEKLRKVALYKDFYLTQTPNRPGEELDPLGKGEPTEED
jgi:hypothetical protein